MIVSGAIDIVTTASNIELAGPEWPVSVDREARLISTGGLEVPITVAFVCFWISDPQWARREHFLVDLIFTGK
jgi:hypothetical protein